MGFNLGKMVAGIGILIAIYLFLSQGDKTAKIITTIANNSVNGIATLQGKDPKVIK